MTRSEPNADRRMAGSLAAVCASVAVAAIAVLPTAAAAGVPQPRTSCGTEIQFGGPDAPWKRDADLTIQIQNRNAVVPATGAVPAGTQVSWSSPQGKANVTFFEGNRFQGAAQFPGEGPVGYRGTLCGQRATDVPAASAFSTEIQFGGRDAEWQADKDLTVQIHNRQAVVPAATRDMPAGTQVTWSGPQGNGSVTFFEGGQFQGAAQFPGEGPVGYRGILK